MTEKKYLPLQQNCLSTAIGGYANYYEEWVVL